MEYRVLGPVEVLADGRPIAIGGPKPRSLLVLLLLNPGRPGRGRLPCPGRALARDLPKLRNTQPHAAPQPNPRQRLSAARLRGYVRYCAAL
jgi:hypothetical protein